jgi:hypothetical protein
MIMFLSARSLGFTPSQSSLAALIPCLLGIIDVMAAMAFSLAGAVFIAAVVAHIFPAQYQSFKDFASGFLKEASSAVIISGSNAFVGSSPAATAAATPATPPQVISSSVPPATPPPVTSGSGAATTGSSAQPK